MASAARKKRIGACRNGRNSGHGRSPTEANVQAEPTDRRPTLINDALPE
jgi:hypothetical protein